MFTPCKKILSLLFVASLLFAAVGVAQAQAGIKSYDRGHYKHATQVLQQEYPAFLTAFEAFKDEIKHIDSFDKQAQFAALMRFFPFIENMAFMDSYVAEELDLGVRWTLQLEVMVSYFVMHLPTADEETTTLHDMLFNSFKVYLANGDATGILSEEDLMKKHPLSRADAQHIRAVLHQLYPTSTLL